MSTETLGWKGKQVRHDDGRTGIIADEFIGFGFAGLTFKLEDNTTHYGELACIGPDKWLEGWQWYCDNFMGGPQWIDFMRTT